jgi:hypothetical protein
MENVEQAADEIGEGKFDALPERVQEALGELAGAAKEGLLASERIWTGAKVAETRRSR